MANPDTPLALLYPSRAEFLKETQYAGYRVFLDFWDHLTEVLREAYRVLIDNKNTHLLGVHGGQGAGKTLFGYQLRQDWESARRVGARNIAKYDDNNLWHRIAGYNKSAAAVSTATQVARVVDVEESVNWVSNLINDLGANRDHPVIAILDNAESYYFIGGILHHEAPNVTFPEDQRMSVAAQALRKLARGQLRNVLLILLTNDEEQLEQLHQAVAKQHRGLMSVGKVSLPTAEEKEKAVRINTNRLNSVSYWYCLDQAGKNEQEKVQASINGADTFPDVFAAVDSALVASPRDARTTKARRKGRPARKNLLSLVCLGDHGDDYKFPTLGVQGYVDAVDEAEADWLNSSWYWTGWAKPSLGDDREAALLESEWNLRVVLLGRQFTDAVLACQAPGANPRHEAAVRRVLGQIELVLGQTASKGARDAYASELEDAVKDWPDTVISDAERTTFWASATTRANVYEAVLQRFYPTYNTRHNASLASRPDLVVSPYVPASIIQQGALRRTAHLIEFTSLKVPDAKSLHNYLGLKLPNYVQMTQEL